MKTIAFFNNKGGVGKTLLVYHLAWMLNELERRVVVADLDPQADLSGMFLDAHGLEEIWQAETKKTIDGNIAPLFAEPGGIESTPYVEAIDEGIGLLVGDLNLSKREDDLSTQWPKCLDRDERAFRVTTAFARLIAHAGKSFEADFALIDVGPNLGAINRAALLACDYVVIPLAPDLFSLQGLRNVGPKLDEWRQGWKKRLQAQPANWEGYLPDGEMRPLGYIVMRQSVRLYRPMQAFQRWIEKMPAEYRQAVVPESEATSIPTLDADEHLLAQLKDYRSLTPLAEEANKPMFMLKPADGAFGSQMRAVVSCYRDFRSLAEKMIARLVVRDQ